MLQRRSRGIASAGNKRPRSAWLKRHRRHVLSRTSLHPTGEFDGGSDRDIRLPRGQRLNALKTMGYRRIGFAGWIERGSPTTTRRFRCRS